MCGTNCAVAPLCPPSHTLRCAWQSRLALFIGGVPFEDCRIAFPAWKEIKSAQPFQQLPVRSECCVCYAFSEKETLSLPSNFFTYSAIAQILEIDGTTVLAQSYAILRYCGAVSGLHPSDLVGAAKVDEILYALMEGASLCEPCMFS